jgi:chorismate-pyruvate lyase
LIERGLSLARSDLCVGTHASAQGESLWARRSVLRSASGTRALVSEYFHPEIWTRIERRY